MLIEVDRHSGIPAYRQILDQVQRLVAGGLLRAGDELPSTRALSARLALNPMTVSKAYALLERDGVVERRPGQTLVVRERSASDVSEDRALQLANELRPAVVAARQLGLERDAALAVFAALLDDQVNSPTGDET